MLVALQETSLKISAHCFQLMGENALILADLGKGSRGLPSADDIQP